MLYAALTFWLLVILFSAWAIHHLWCDLVKPRIVNAILLPGTLVAQLAHVLGLLITGNSVRNVSLMGDDERGDPTTDSPEKNRLPIFGAIIVAWLPLLACGTALYFVGTTWGMQVLRNFVISTSLPTALPTTRAGVWDLLHGALDVSENMLNAILESPLADLRVIAFLYLSICLTVRMTPFADSRRGAIIAMFISGVIIAALGALNTAVGNSIERAWPLLSFAVGMLLFLLLLTLLIAGVAGLIKLLARRT